MPELAEALSWTGFRVDDVYGARVGRVDDIYVDHDRGTPLWIFTKMGRFTDAHTLIPLQDAVAGAGHVWVPFEKDLIRRAPQFAVAAPLTQDRELALCGHYGLMSSRGAELTNVPPTALTAVGSATVRTGLPPMSRDDVRLSDGR